MVDLKGENYGFSDKILELGNWSTEEDNMLVK